MPYTFLPDTSVMYNKKIVDLIEHNVLVDYQPEAKSNVTQASALTIILSRTMLAEIENQANQTKSSQNVELEVLNELNALKTQGKILIEIVGDRPNLDQIKLNPGGELDAIIRRDAYDAKAVLVTADEVQASVARVEGIGVLFTVNLPETEVQKDDGGPEFANASIQDFFDDQTMSVHLRGHCTPLAKRGSPGNWRLDPISEEIMAPHTVADISNRIIRQAKNDEMSFIERNERGVTVIQLQNYRIVICRPPFSNTYEITAVKPLVSLTLEDYHLPKKVFDRLDVAEGILVAGAPGAGKSTFISALALFYLEKNKLVKTIESVRDLNVPPEVSQYAPLDGSMEKTADILLLIRPDFTVFDEVRTESDFKIFGDLRLAGVGLVGVVHAAKAVDAVQRFIRRVELGVIPNIIDTIIFIQAGQVAEILSLEMTVKKPTGFADRDLSRPVIEVRDFLYHDLLYEIYAFGSDVIVAPVGKPRRSYGGYGKKKGRSSHKKRNYGGNYDNYEPDDGQSDYEPGSQTYGGEGQFDARVHRKKNGFVISVDPSLRNTYMNFSHNGNLLFSATLNKNGDVNIKQTSPVYSRLSKIVKKGLRIKASYQ